MPFHDLRPRANRLVFRFFCRLEDWAHRMVVRLREPSPLDFTGVLWRMGPAPDWDNVPMFSEAAAAQLRRDLSQENALFRYLARDPFDPRFGYCVEAARRPRVNLSTIRTMAEKNAYARMFSGARPDDFNEGTRDHA